MGMTDWQMLTQVELPLALSVIIAGVRVATVIAVGTATIAAAIGAGGLGMFIFRGLRMDDDTLIFAGAIPAAIMALGADFALGWVEKRLAPGARRSSSKTARRAVVTGIMILFISSALFLARGRCVSPRGCVVVGSKDFTEQVILGELIAQTIKDRAGVEVEQQFELGGNMCHRAMLVDEMDIYVEYTGTAFMAMLKHDPLTDAEAVYLQTRDEYASRFGFEVLEPLGFENTFAILVRGADARRLNLKKISDVVAYAPEWRAGFGQDFMSREDGYPGFARTYGLSFREPPREMDLSLTYRALANNQVDLIAGNSTDGLIDKLDLYQLEDDRHYFPPYQAVPIVRKETLSRYPEIAEALNGLAGKITDADMRRLNYAVDGEKRDVREVVREFLLQRQAHGLDLVER
jgi:osmoprotectant transport system permease protein